MRVIYFLIVFYLSVHLIWYLFRQKNFWSQASTVIVLALFLLRLFLIK